MKLRKQIFLITTTIAIIPLLLITFFSYSRYNHTISEQITVYSDNLYNNAVYTANDSLEDLYQTISYLTLYSSEGKYSLSEWLKPFSADGDYTSYDIQQTYQYCQSVFQNLIWSDEDIDGIYIFTPSGVIFDSYTTADWALVNKYDPTSEEWYNDVMALDGSFYISDNSCHSMFKGDDSSIFLAQKIRDIYTHEVLGIILVNCEPGILNLDSMNIIPNVLRLSVYNTQTESNLYVSDTAEEFQENKQNITKSTELFFPQLTIQAEFSYSALYQMYNQTAILLVMVAFICIAAFIVSTWFISGRLVRPIEELSRTMAEQRGQNYDFSSPYMKRTDEIGTLYNEYAMMLKNLEASMQREYKQKLISLDSQMKSLEARINTHFLFNTLESINSMAEIDDNEEIAVMSLALGNMFRYTIKTQSEIVTIREEIAHVKDYVSIQEIRFSNRFALELSISEELYERRVLKLILQPLVENAITHGLNYCTCGDRIRISAWEKEGNLFLAVEDNGQGMSADVLQKLNDNLHNQAVFTEIGRRSKQSIGLKNIHSRIELYYGTGYGLTIASQEGTGTTITIQVPII